MSLNNCDGDRRRSIQNHPKPLHNYLAQNYFHHIDVTYPGLELVHEEPYIFIVNNFLTVQECEKLVLKIATNRQVPSSPNDNGRTSTSVIARNDELPTVRAKLATLANVAAEQMQPTKMTHYGTGQVFARHTDCTYYEKQLIVDYLLRTEHDGEPFDTAKHHYLFERIPDRFCTVFVYLNSVPMGGCTRWSNLREDPHLYTRTLPAIGDVVGYPPPASRPLQPEGAATELSIAPRQGMAVVHFPVSTPSMRGVRDHNADHESEAAVDPKFILQQFIWSSALDPSDPNVIPQIRQKMSEHLASEPTQPLTSDLV
jgi:hypothetical protein